MASLISFKDKQPNTPNARKGKHLLLIGKILPQNGKTIYI